MAFGSVSSTVPPEALQQPQAGQQSQSTTGFAQDFDTFLTILTTQLQQQDPTDPMDSSEFTDQLVQFASVEQEIRSNDQLEEINTRLGTNQALAAVGFLGHDAKIEADTGRLEPGDDAIRFAYRLPQSADETTLEVLDADGDVVQSVNGKTGAGEHDFVFDALDSAGQRRPDGPYTLRVKAESADGGQDLTVPVFVTDTVRSIDTTGTDPTVTVGGKTVSMDEVLALTAPAQG